MFFNLHIQAIGKHGVQNYHFGSDFVWHLVYVSQLETTVLEFQKSVTFDRLCTEVKRRLPLAQREDGELVYRSALSLAAIVIYASKLESSEVLAVPLVEPSSRDWGCFRDHSVLAKISECDHLDSEGIGCF